MISGSHVVLYSKNADADRVFFRDVLQFPSVDAGHGWLIFALPPAESAFHPTDEEPAPGQMHGELYLMCDDLEATMKSLQAKGVQFTPVQSPPWGALTTLRLPSGGEIGLYQPKHVNAIGGTRKADSSLRVE